MSWRKTLFFLIFSVSFSLCSYAIETSTQVWDYGNEIGPAVWGELSKDFKLCASGKKQSPINIETSWTKNSLSLSAIKLAYKSSAIHMVNNGHWIELEFDKGSKLIFGPQEYELKQIQLHAPAEHLIDKKQANIEIQFLHRDKEGHLLILALMLYRGKMNYALHSLFDYIPAISNTKNFIEDKKINPLDFLPEGGGYYTYMGSLTSPPCSENVRWIILSHPIEASLQQIKKLTNVYRMNNRPFQPLNRRKVLQKL